jgi:hypothetical protein
VRLAFKLPYRINCAWNGTTQRELFVNGTSAGVDAAVTQKPGTGSDALWVGAEDTTLAEEFTGAVQHVYLRNELLSDDWLAAEDASWRTRPASTPSSRIEHAAEPQFLLP